MHAGGVGPMEAAHAPWDGDHRHGGATAALHGARVLGSAGKEAPGEAFSVI